MSTEIQIIILYIILKMIGYMLEHTTTVCWLSFPVQNGADELEIHPLWCYRLALFKVSDYKIRVGLTIRAVITTELAGHILNNCYLV